VRYTPADTPVRTVLVTGGVHGNEPMGAEAALRFIELLARTPEDYPDTAFVVFPVVNPWGYVYNQRLNQQGYDINRDFGPFSTQEARLVRDAIAGELFALAIDHHEDNTALGFYLYDVGTPHENLCREIIGEVRRMGHAIEQETWMVIFKTDDGLIDAPVWSLHVAGWTIGNSLVNYARLHHTENAFLPETPTHFKPRERLELHDLARECLLAGVTAGE
jgi:murein peptide amidase A